MQPEQDNWQQPTPTTGGYQPDVTSSQLQDEQLAAESSAPAETYSDTPEFAGETNEPAALDGTEEAVRWQANEHIERDQDGLWYGGFAVIVSILILLAIFWIKSITFAILIPVMAAALVVYNRRPPSIISYTLGRQGIHVNDQLHSYEEFKEFGLINGDDQHSVLLVPRQRFMPGITVYFPEEVGEAVIDILASHLPMHEIKLHPIDRLTRRLRI